MSRTPEPSDGRQSDLAYRRMREMARSREFRPGQVLSENELAKLLGVGRTPVREAVLRLGYEGLFEMMPKRGILVRSLTATDISELYEVRSRLETLAAWHAATPGRMGKATHEHLAEVIEQEAVAAAADEIDPTELRTLDRDFHTTIWEYAGNERLRTMLLSLLDAAELDPVWDQIMIVLAQRSDSHLEHQEILDAIVAHDQPRAERAMREHNHSYQRSLMTRLTSNGSGPG